MEPINSMKVIFQGISSNEAFARVAVASFVAQLDPTVEELEDIKTAVSEAVTNSIIHGYEDKQGMVEVHCTLYMQGVEIIIKDTGKGIENVEQARVPLYTSKPELERSGMGFTVMETFMDQVSVESSLNNGTVITMVKNLASKL